MKAFPGFSWECFSTMPLDVYAETYALAIEVLDNEAEAIRAAQNRG